MYPLLKCCAKPQQNVRPNGDSNPWRWVFQANARKQLTRCEHLAVNISHQMQNAQKTSTTSQPPTVGPGTCTCSTTQNLTGCTSMYIHWPNALVFSNAGKRYPDMVAIYPDIVAIYPDMVARDTQTWWQSILQSMLCCTEKFCCIENSFSTAWTELGILWAFLACNSKAAPP